MNFKNYYKEPSEDVGYEEIMVMECKCVNCGAITKLEVPTDHWAAWQHRGAYIQDAFPELSKAERELLISGFCGTCWDVIFPKEDH